MVLSADVEWNDGRRHSIKPYQLFRKRKPQKHKHLWKLSFNLPLLLRNMTVTRGIRSVTLRAELQSELFGKQGQNKEELLLVPPEDPFQVRSRTFFWHTYYVNTRQHLRNFCRWHVIRKAIWCVEFFWFFFQRTKLRQPTGQRQQNSNFGPSLLK